jgi:nitric oxide reductase NorD protein
MNERDRGHMFDGEAENETSAPPLDRTLKARVRQIKNASERRNAVRLARELGSLPTERGRAALEAAAALAGVSLRVSIEFLKAAPEAARILDADGLRQWGEWGRRISITDVEAGADFFRAGVENLAPVPARARALLLQICARQTTLSSSIAFDTAARAPALAEATSDEETLIAILSIALEIARRSAKHSADFLQTAPRTIRALNRFSEKDVETKQAAIRLVALFAARAGGVSSDVWSELPSALDGLDAQAALRLIEETENFLERGGAVGLQFLIAGAEVLRRAEGAFGDWARLLEAISSGAGNAALVSLARATPAFFQALTAGAANGNHRAVELSRKVLGIAREITHTDAEAAILCFRSAPTALRHASIEDFERWAEHGLTFTASADARKRRSYYALETKHSRETLRGVERSGDDKPAKGTSLESVAPTLRLYVEGLTGHAVEIAPLSAVPTESRIGDGQTIHLPSMVSEFGSEEINFRLYKVLAAHAAGQIEFGTYAPANAQLQAAFDSLSELYADENADARDAFALDGYINDLSQSEPALAPEEEASRARTRRKRLPPDADYRYVLAVFPEKRLATRIFGTLENGRVDHHLRRQYRGLRRDLDFVREHIRAHRPQIARLPITLVPFELLFQITLCGGALNDARAFYGQIVSELEAIVADYLTAPEASVADTLMATSRVYQLFASISIDDSVSSRESVDKPQASDEEESESQEPQEATEVKPEAPPPRERKRTERRDPRDLFSAWANTDFLDPIDDELDGSEVWASAEMPEQPLETGDVAFTYDEWDRELADARVGWCRVVERRVRLGDRSFVELTRSRYRGLISSIRHQFQLMRPEGLKRVANELDGDDFDLNAVVGYVTDRRAARRRSGAGPSERIYTKRLRREREVVVAFLLDQSSSTARTIGRHPLQPYTHPGRRIIEIEKEGLVLMSEALEAVGDRYAMYGFTSEGRRNVRFYIVKDFDENYTDETERRIGGINYQHNTRLGAAVRHAAARLLSQSARTRLLIILSDGRPYDHDYGDARYAREDTREALKKARTDGITPFCITIDRDSESELRDLYGDVGYTIIDDVLSLPERMPAIYRRLTT